MNIVKYYWDHEFKHKSQDYKSNCVLLRWEDSDELKNLFAILFGYFPSNYNLKNNFENAFLKDLRSEEITISPNESINKKLVEKTHPLKATKLELKGYGGAWRGNGIYIGDIGNFSDLLYFWNLRFSIFNIYIS